MQTFSQTRAFFERKLKQELDKTEKSHESLKKLNIIYIIGISVFVVSIFIENMLLAFISFVPVVLLILVNKKKYDAARSDYKRVLVGPLLKSIDTKLQYKPNGKISEYKLEHSLLFRNSTRYESENLITYPLGKESVTMAYVNAYSETQDLDEDDMESEQIVFSGLFATIKSSRTIEGKVCVFPDFAQKHLGFIGEGIQGSKYEKLQKAKLDDPRFEKEFLVYANDQVTANYILTHTIMEVLTKVTQKEKKKISISFIGDKIYIGLSIPYGFFQHNISKKLTDFSAVSESLKSFYTVVDILEDIYQHHEL